MTRVGLVGALALLVVAGCGSSKSSSGKGADSADNTGARLQQCVEQWNSLPSYDRGVGFELYVKNGGPVGVYLTFDPQGRCLLATASESLPGGGSVFAFTYTRTSADSVWGSTTTTFSQPQLASLDNQALNDPNATFGPQGGLTLTSTSQGYTLAAEPAAAPASPETTTSAAEAAAAARPGNVAQAPPGVSACPDSFGGGNATNITVQNSDCDGAMGLISAYISAAGAQGSGTAPSKAGAYTCTPSPNGGTTHVRCVSGQSIIEFDLPG